MMVITAMATTMLTLIIMNNTMTKVKTKKMIVVRETVMNQLTAAAMINQKHNNRNLKDQRIFHSLILFDIVFPSESIRE